MPSSERGPSSSTRPSRRGSARRSSRSHSSAASTRRSGTRASIPATSSAASRRAAPSRSTSRRRRRRRPGAGARRRSGPSARPSRPTSRLRRWRGRPRGAGGLARSDVNPLPRPPGHRPTPTQPPRAIPIRRRRTTGRGYPRPGSVGESQSEPLGLAAGGGRAGAGASHPARRRGRPLQCRVDRRRLPIGIQTFRQIREEGYYYVDKTAYARRLASDAGKHYFLSRPRRFGKSLFLDTLKELYEGAEELFRGLAVHDGVGLVAAPPRAAAELRRRQLPAARHAGRERDDAARGHRPPSGRRGRGRRRAGALPPPARGPERTGRAAGRGAGRRVRQADPGTRWTSRISRRPTATISAGCTARSRTAMPTWSSPSSPA